MKTFHHPRLMATAASLTLSLAIGCTGQGVGKGRGSAQPQSERTMDTADATAAGPMVDEVDGSTMVDAVEEAGSEQVIEAGPQDEKVADEGQANTNTNIVSGPVTLPTIVPTPVPPVQVQRTAYQTPAGLAAFKCRSKQSYKVPSNAGDLTYDRLELAGANLFPLAMIDGVLSPGKILNGVYVSPLSATKGGERAVIYRSRLRSPGDPIISLEHANRPATMLLSEPCVYRFRFDSVGRLIFEE